MSCTNKWYKRQQAQEGLPLGIRHIHIPPIIHYIYRRVYWAWTLLHSPTKRTDPIITTSFTIAAKPTQSQKYCRKVVSKGGRNIIQSQLSDFFRNKTNPLILDSLFLKTFFALQTIWITIGVLFHLKLGKGNYSCTRCFTQLTDLNYNKKLG